MLHSIQRTVLEVFCENHVSQKAGAAESFFNHLRRHRRLHWTLILAAVATVDRAKLIGICFLRRSSRKYLRHPRNIGALPNFKFLADQAKGEFLIIHQDDDLLHRDFLRNCYETVSANQEVVLYATPWWRGNPASGFKSKLLRNPASKDFAYIVEDQPLILDGRTMAVSLLHSFYFAHPTLLLRPSHPGISPNRAGRSRRLSQRYGEHKRRGHRGTGVVPGQAGLRSEDGRGIYGPWRERIEDDG